MTAFNMKIVKAIKGHYTTLSGHRRFALRSVKSAFRTVLPRRLKARAFRMAEKSVKDWEMEYFDYGLSRKKLHHPKRKDLLTDWNKKVLKNVSDNSTRMVSRLNQVHSNTSRNIPSDIMPASKDSSESDCSIAHSEVIQVRDRVCSPELSQHKTKTVEQIELSAFSDETLPSTFWKKGQYSSTKKSQPKSEPLRYKKSIRSQTKTSKDSCYSEKLLQGQTEMVQQRRQLSERARDSGKDQNSSPGSSFTFLSRSRESQPWLAVTSEESISVSEHSMDEEISAAEPNAPDNLAVELFSSGLNRIMRTAGVAVQPEACTEASNILMNAAHHIMNHMGQNCTIVSQQDVSSAIMRAFPGSLLGSRANIVAIRVNKSEQH